MKKWYTLLFIFNILISLQPIVGVNPTFHKGKCQQRWAKMICTHAQLESNITKKTYLFNRAIYCTQQSDDSFKKISIRYPQATQRELVFNEKLLQRINNREKNAQKAHRILARKAAIHSMIAHHAIKEYYKTSQDLSSFENLGNTPRSRMVFLTKPDADTEKVIEALKTQTAFLLKKAQDHFYRAAHLYIKSYELSEKKLYKNRAEKIITHYIHDLEVEQLNQSPIFTIPQEKTTLLKELYT